MMVAMFSFDSGRMWYLKASVLAEGDDDDVNDVRKKTLGRKQSLNQPLALP